MIIKVLATGSSGNSYAIMDSYNNVLAIEAWLNPHSFIANFGNEKNIRFCGWIYSHKHCDHYVHNIANQYNMYFGKEISEFKVFSFPVAHERKNPQFENSGFVIQTKCRKSVLFITDFYEIGNSTISELSKINYDVIMIECSYNNFIYKDLEPDVKERLLNHCSDDHCVRYVKSICGNNKGTLILTLHKSNHGGRAGLILSKFAANGFKNVRVAVKGTNITI